MAASNKEYRYIKEAKGTFPSYSKLLSRPGKPSSSLGDDDLTLPAMALGAQGVISVVANVAPRKTVAMVDAMMKGDLEKARSLHYELAPLVRAMFLETNPIPVKTAHKYLGLAGGPLRLPLGEMAADKEKMLKELLKPWAKSMTRVR